MRVNPLLSNKGKFNRVFPEQEEDEQILENSLPDSYHKFEKPVKSRMDILVTENDHNH